MVNSNLDTILDIVTKWRKTFGLRTDGDGDLAEAELAMTLINEENKEYLEALNNNDVIEQIDALCDIIFVSKQLLDVTKNRQATIFAITNIKDAITELKKLDVNPVAAVEEVYNSNMSKLCLNEHDAITSVIKYADEGIQCYYKEIEGDRYIIYRSSDNKVLKGIHFFTPNFSKIIKANI